ncbi:MAG: DUF5686 and carboxypeptidase regulatory-like domain-containing protein [Bacteroidota bacterium]|nr:DUF5686 and carboxypeptidase regulatory-like domain-containing protein [Bacteroidota bacterium]
MSGLVTDESGKQPLAFVNIGAKGTRDQASTDIDGKFELNSSSPRGILLFSLVGYESLEFPLEEETFIHIRLTKKTINLSEVEVAPGENPAHRIIRLANKNRDKNNPEKISSYVCETYSKTYYDLVYNKEEIKTKSDSAKNDSLKSRLRIFSENSHLLMMESVTERKFLFPGNLNERIVATKVSGFKDPSFSTSATDLQPFSFYEDHFKILGKNYLNPISTGSTNKYLFQIEDTLFIEKDTVFVISYRPLKGKNFDGLEGVISIHTNGYAIQNVIAAPYDKGLIDLRIRQQYVQLEGKQWFPEQLSYELHYKKYPSKFMGMKLSGKSYIKNVKLDTALRKRDFSFETIAMEKGAAQKDEGFWVSKRVDTLDPREQKTYRVIDSLGKKQNFDRTLKIIESLFTFQLPVSIVNIDLNKIIGLNDYEIVRAGIGLHTNDKLSRWFSVGGYIGYGYKDSAIKYGGDLRINLRKDSKEYYLKFLYSRDLSEPGRSQYFYTKNNLSRNLMTYRMDFIEQQELSLNFRALNYLRGSIALNKNFRKPHYDYLFLSDNDDSTEVSTAFKSTEIRLKGRYAFKEKLVQSFGQLLSDGTKYPVIHFAYTHGIKIPEHGFYEYNKLSIGIEKSFLIRNFGKTNILLEGGLVQGDVPYPYLFNGNGSYTKGNYIYVENTFQTMGLYEFLSDRYVNLFFSHNFGSLLFKRPNFQPQFVLVSNVGFGDLRKPQQHRNLQVKQMDKGFFESGLFINNILRVNYYNLAYVGIGGGAFIRYGKYAHPEQNDNYTYKLTLTVTF